MKKIISKVKEIKDKAVTWISRAKGKISASILGLSTMAMSLTASAATSINTGLDTEQLVGGIIDFICKVAFYMGFVVVATGVFMLVFAYKDDNAEGQSRAVRVAVVGAILIGLTSILKLTGIIN